MPSTYSVPSTMNATIANTLMPANQNSNSPYDRTENEVGRRHQHHQPEGQQPQRRVHPVGDDLRPGHRLEADHDDPEVPVQPPDGEPCPAAEGPPRVVGEGPRRRAGHGHLAEHPHHHDDQHAGDRIGQPGRRAGVEDDQSRADEQTGPDHPADRDHAQMPLAQALVELGRRCTHVTTPSLAAVRDDSTAPQVALESPCTARTGEARIAINSKHS